MAYSSIVKVIYNIQDLKIYLKLWNLRNYKLVFTNGCFDILHQGHVDYLEEAKRLGDKLIVGLNSDQSIQKLKGFKRPIINHEARARVLAALQFVDLVVIFDEETPFSLIQQVQPDVLIKGSDYSIDKIVGADIVLAKGGEVKTIDLTPGWSTSKIIEKIQAL